MRLNRTGVGMAAVMVGVLGLVGCASKAPPIQVSEVFTARSLQELVANSDAVVSGAVIKVQDGRIVGENAPEQLTQVSLQVDRVLFGTTVSDLVLVEEGSGIPPEISQVGDSGIFFLHLKDDNKDVPYYRLVSSQGRFIENAEGVVASNDEAAWVRELEALSPSEFEKAVADAIGAASAAA